MFVIITYDVGEKRVNKVRKKLKQYLMWTQNSVFEGDITEGKLQKCMAEVNKIIKKEEDSVYIYRIYFPAQIQKDIMGVVKSYEDIFI
ncbi:CRISPR-associated endoribonuclease Cas2 [Caloramator mitchellensis]|uniref:CRISPR-associated endoribonuclease Cas2 n=1 Tax=Caloramator mitchellensis TaxID=908809 RepID=A0A0R3JXG8_CALMK|nr:CRISPR-associated endonuclease Cas2 [Caloramator mitchellensis]KRQ85886.1 CRISPR-associated endoribonuclease Cas2 [Caloramator mitchellensis]